MALTTTQIQNAYVAFFNRPADVAGLTYWSSYAGSSADLLNTFAQSTEYKNLYSGLNNTQIVNAVYGNLFGHAPDVAGLNYWVTQLDQGKLSIGNIADAVNKGAQGTDATIVANKVAAATAFTTALDTTAEVLGYAGASSATMGQVKAWLSAVTDTSTSLETAKSGLTALTSALAGGTNEAAKEYVLTTAQDTFTGTNGNDNFRAVAGNTVGTQDQTTLNSSDIIDGGTGADTLIVNMTGSTYNGGARIKNIETLQIGTNQPTATFDYNVNAGSNEITEVTKVVYDQINVGENLAVIDLLKTGSAIPTLAWTNEANSTAGTINADFRQSAVEGSSTAVTVELNNVLASNTSASTGRLNIGAGVETLNIVSGGTSGLNTLNTSLRNDGSAVDIVSAGSQFNATGFTASEGLNDDGSLKTVVVTGSQAFGKAATVVTDTTNASFGLVNRAVAGDLGLQNADASASNLVSLAATVTTLDASAATGDTNIRFTSRVDAAEVNVTYKGGKGNDYVEFQQGNINATGGDGNDTFAFVNTQNNSTLTTADTIVGGAGTDTIQMGVNGSGSYNLDTTEFNNKTGIDVLDLRGATNTVRLADAFVGAADAGLTVRTDKIVQTSDTNTANSSTVTANNGLENASTNTVTLTALSANRAVEFIGGSGSDRIVVNEVSLNSNVKLDGGTNITTTGRFDTITVQDSAVLSRGDLANVKNFEGIVLVKSDTTSARQYTIEVTESFLTNNSGQNKTLQIGTIAAANQNALTNVDTVTIDVSDLLTTSNTLKTAGYDRKIDTTSLTAANVTVQYVANGGAVTAATLQGLGVLASTADASQSLVLASAASAVSNAGALVAPIALSNTAEIITANATALTGGANTADTLTVTNAGTVTVGSQTTALETLILANGTNTVTFAQAGFTSVTGGTGADTVNLNNLALSASASLGDGADNLSIAGTRTGTLAGGNGADTLTLTGASNLVGATVSGFETLAGAFTVSLTADQLNAFTTGVNTGANLVTVTTAGTMNVTGTSTQFTLANGTNDFTHNTALNQFTGGTGNDTLNLSYAILQAATGAINFTSGAADTLNITTALGGALNLGALTGGGAVTNVDVVNVTGGTTATWTFTNANGASTVNFTADAAGNNINNIQLGTGGQTLNMLGTGTGAATITGGAGADTINLSATVARADTIAAGSVIGAIDTVSNFKAAGADIFKTGVNAGTLNNLTIATADTTTLAAAIQTAATAAGATLTANTQAYFITVSAGTAAGTYAFQNIGGTVGTVDATDFIVKLTGTVGSIVAGDFTI